MAQYNFEGDLENLNERQLQFIHKVILDHDSKFKKAYFSKLGQAGDNFVGNVKRISVEGEKRTIKMVLKYAVSDAMLRDITNTEVMFKNEHIMYTEVLPKFVELQRTVGVPEQDQYRYAKCYGSLNEAPSEVIILEDLNESGFSMLNKFNSLSNECVISILQNFAAMHSLSYVLKNKEAEKFNHFKEQLTDPWKSAYDKPELKNRFQIVEDEIVSVLEDSHHKKLVKNKIIEIFELRAKLIEFEKSNKYSVIQQGDAWTNNIMFKLDQDPVQSILIDFQASFNNSPVIDLLFMIFNCTDHETRVKHYYDWIDYYHSELDKSLSNFGLKVSLIYPRDQMDADIRTYAKLIFGQSLVLANMLMRDPKEAAELVEVMRDMDKNAIPDTMKTGNLQVQSQNRIKKRIFGVIDSFEEFGLLEAVSQWDD
uniref:CHK kinase-like domain-containing protein n=1 Tax=Heliothis virescens TaxID=7102 RepID=A0A2A4JDX0_HELVI